MASTNTTRRGALYGAMCSLAQATSVSSPITTPGLPTTAPAALPPLPPRHRLPAGVDDLVLHATHDLAGRAVADRRAHRRGELPGGFGEPVAAHEARQPPASEPSKLARPGGQGAKRVDQVIGEG